MNDPLLAAALNRCGDLDKITPCNRFEVENMMLSLYGEILRLRRLLDERKRHLREASRGAERNAIALQLACARQYKTNSMSKSDQTDMNKHRTFIEAFNNLAKDVHTTAISKGWWDKQRSDGDLIALVHSELSEALEAMRHGNPPDDKIPDYSGAEAELADAIIRIMDFSVGRQWNVAEALVAKMKYNETRPAMHGGKKF